MRKVPGTIRTIRGVNTVKNVVEELKKTKEGNAILKFATRLYLSDNIGDVMDDVGMLLMDVGLNLRWGDPEELSYRLHKSGYTTPLSCTDLHEEE